METLCIIDGMSQFVEYLNKAMGERGINAGTLSRKSGVHRQTIYKLLAGKSKRPDPDTITKLANGLGRPREEMMRVAGYSDGKSGEHFREGGVSENSLMRQLSALGKDVFAVGPQVQVPIIGVIRAGMPILAYENIEGNEPVRLEDVIDGEYTFMRVEGDSMSGDGILNNTLVLVRKQDYAGPHNIAVVLIDNDEAALKRVVPVGDEWVMLVSSNPLYPQQPVKARDVQILGIVTKSVTYHER